MKFNKIFRTLALAIILSLLMLAIPATPALAQSVTLSPTSGPVGTLVTVTGTGFVSQTTVYIFFGFAIYPIASAIVSPVGYITAFTIPGSATPGITYVIVRDGPLPTDTSLAAAPFTVIERIITLSSSSGYVGEQITVSGTGFAASSTVIIYYDDVEGGTAISLSEPFTFITNTDANGAFSADFEAPVSTGGAHTITASDGINTLSETFYMESTPPSTVYPLLPAMDSKLRAWQFDWCGNADDPSIEVTDDSLPITYTLEIATDADFTNIVLRKEGLTTSEYTLTKEESQLLPSTKKEAPYYWHVKAIDSAFNETDWTGTGAFYVGFTFTMPQWAIYTLIGLGSLLLSFFSFWLGRRTAYY